MFTSLMMLPHGIPGHKVESPGTDTCPASKTHLFIVWISAGLLIVMRLFNVIGLKFRLCFWPRNPIMR